MDVAAELMGYSCADGSSDSARRPDKKLFYSSNDGLSFFGRGTNGRGVLLIHGVTGSPIEMKYIGKRLHRAGYTVYAPLLAGHGVDVRLLRQSTWPDWFETVAKAAGDLSKDVDRLFVAGVCVGGLLGLRLAHANPAIAAVTVYSPALRYDGWNAPLHYKLGHLSVPVAVALGFSRWIALKERFPFGIKSDRIRRLLAESPEGIRGTMPTFPVDTIHQNYRLFAQMRRLLPDIRTPTLLVHAREDDLASPANARLIKARIGGPCEIEWLDNSYHMVHVDQEHAHVAECTRTFFDSRS